MRAATVGRLVLSIGMLASIGCAGGSPFRASQRSSALATTLSQAELDNKHLRSQLDSARAEALAVEDELNEERSTRKKLSGELANLRRRSGENALSGEFPSLPSPETVPAGQPGKRRPYSIQIPGPLEPEEGSSADDVSWDDSASSSGRVARVAVSPWLPARSSTGLSSDEEATRPLPDRRPAP